MNSGVYIIRNYINNKVYIGSTVDVNARWSRHTTLQRSTCVKLRNAMMKHGVDQFFWEWLEQIDVSTLPKCEARTVLLEREQFFLDTLNPYGANGYNIAVVAGSTLGITFSRRSPRPYKHTQDWIRKVSGRNSKKNKPVRQYTTDGGFIREYFNVSDASGSTTGATIQAIVKCCKHTQKTAGGFCWSYASLISVAAADPHKSKSVSSFDADGTYLATYRNAKAAAESLGKSANPIYKCCRGEQRLAHGVGWRISS